MPLNATLMATEMAVGMGYPSASSEVQGISDGIIDELKDSAVVSVGSPTGTISSIDENSMATRIITNLGQASISTEILGLCNAVKSHLETSGIVTYPSPPYVAGGIVSGLVGATLATLMQSGMGYPSVSAQLLGMASAITLHIMTNAICNAGAMT